MKELNVKPKSKSTTKSNQVQKEEKEKFQGFVRSSRDANVCMSMSVHPSVCLGQSSSLETHKGQGVPETHIGHYYFIIDIIMQIIYLNVLLFKGLVNGHGLFGKFRTHQKE